MQVCCERLRTSEAMAGDGTLTALLDAARARLHEARELDPSVWAQILGNTQVAESLPRVWACSEFIAMACSRDPGLLLSLLDHGRLLERAAVDWIAEDLHAHELGTEETAWMESLRRFRRRHMVRIAWRDISGWADLDETLRDLSMLADVCIQFAYRTMYELLTARYGTPRGETSNEAQPLLILGMGKLGAHELNYSSDIDLVLLYPEEGQTDGGRCIDNAEFFLRLGQKITQLLSTQTVDGFVYRVDLRLRPFGDSGRVAMGFAAFEDYLQQHGRDWERYAYIKARAITAPEHFASLYEQVLRPFVFRRYLDFSVFESLRDMKAMIAREVERRELRDNIKLGPGGIREIEFIVQAFQLIRGGGDRRLQSRELRTVLPLLAISACLDARPRRIWMQRIDFFASPRTGCRNGTMNRRTGCRRMSRRTRFAFSLGMADWEFHRGNSRVIAIASRDASRRRCSGRWAARPISRSPPPSSIWMPRRRIVSTREESRPRRSPALSATASIELRISSYYRRLDDTGRRRLRAVLRPIHARRIASSIRRTSFTRTARNPGNDRRPHRVSRAA